MAEDYQTQWQPADDAGFADTQDSGTPKRKAGLAQGLVGGAQNKLFSLADNGKSELANSIDGIVVIIRELAEKAESVGGGPIAGYVRQAADAIGDIQQTIRDTPVEDLIDEGRDLVRRSPGLAVGIAVAAGFLGARLVKAGSR
ncbi:hypothetical protein [Sandarakinorhabdus sp. DWP1-3-1]|uniref:hypothetical protein n=1 Tax=Sandarakinorhabdus sp. DWP1-3-1 TaxID=2804627 RepID=UPI003CEC6551